MGGKMVTNLLIDYLKDESVSIKKKKIYLERLNLPYSDLFMLKDMFEYDSKLYQVLHGLIYYDDSGFKEKINYQNNKRKNGSKQKQMKRGNRYDKHKRR